MITVDNTTLNDVTQAQFDDAFSIIIDVLRTGYPELDLRTGTALRSLLLEPSATVSALNVARAEHLASALSVLGLTQSFDVPDDVARLSAAALLSNFNITYNAGYYASGDVLIRVDASREYHIPAGFSFMADNGRSFTLHDTYRATPGGADTSNDEALIVPLLPHTAGGLFFVVPAIADEIGARGNIVEGTALTPSSSLYGLIQATAWGPFSGGAAAEDVHTAMARIPTAIAARGMTSTGSITAQLFDRFSVGDPRVTALSVQGYGDPAQIRDKHNVLGVSTGGRADVFVRTGAGLPVITLLKPASYVPGVGHVISIPASEAPGAYAVKGVFEPGSEAIMGTYAFIEAREASADCATAGHDIDVRNPTEFTFTAYQTLKITVTGAGTTDKLFKVALYTFPGIDTVQEYIDASNVRNSFADIIVRSALPCIISVVATVRYHATLQPPDITKMRDAVTDYINSRNFAKRITRSEITAVMLEAGALSADLGIMGMRLKGRILGADGAWRELSGDAIDAEDVANGAALIDRNTVVFATSADMISIQGVAE